jgi:tripartite-type tricarboxylate transporter receptor subunit TctC
LNLLSIKTWRSATDVGRRKLMKHRFADPKIKARLAEFGGMPVTGAPADFGRMIADEIEKWAQVIKFAGIKPE